MPGKIRITSERPKMGSKSAIMNLLLVQIDFMAVNEVDKDPGYNEVCLQDNRLVFGYKLPRNRKALVDVLYENDGHTHRKLINLWRHKPEDLTLAR